MEKVAALDFCVCEVNVCGVLGEVCEVYVWGVLGADVVDGSVDMLMGCELTGCEGGDGGSAAR